MMTIRLVLNLIAGKGQLRHPLLGSLQGHWQGNLYLFLVHKVAFWSPFPLEEWLVQPRFGGGANFILPQVMRQTLLTPHGMPHPL